VLSTGSPQAVQKRFAPGTGSPQCGHVALSDVPQEPQNLAPSGLAPPHARQGIGRVAR
jgi:hypothetical protein